MSRTDRILAFAGLTSLLLHLVALFATPSFELYRADAEDPPVPLEARILIRVPSPVAEPVPAPQAKTAAKRRSAPKERIARAREAPTAAPLWIERPGDLGEIGRAHV